jgi:hypothetical protein
LASKTTKFPRFLTFVRQYLTIELIVYPKNCRRPGVAVLHGDFWDRL